MSKTCLTKIIKAFKNHSTYLNDGRYLKRSKHIKQWIINKLKNDNMYLSYELFMHLKKNKYIYVMDY